MKVFTTDGKSKYFPRAAARVEDGILIVYRGENRVVDEILSSYPLTSVLRWEP